MLWFTLSFLAALSVATQDAWVKKFFSSRNSYEMLSFPLLYSLPFLLLTIPFIPVPELDAIFYWSFIISLPLNAVAYLLYIHAIRVSPLSLTLPYLSFSPVFMILTGYLILGETLNSWGIIGIIIICMGGYVLNIESGKNSIFAPIEAIFKERGSWSMLIVAFIFSFAAVIGKKGILHSSTLFFTISFFTAFSIFMLFFLRLLGKIHFSTLKKQKTIGLIAGILFFTHMLLHGYAISITKAAYMISVKRLSVLMGLIYGGIIFHEKNLVTRTIGTTLMVAGAALISLKAT